MEPGEMVFTRILLDNKSSDKPLANEITAAFAAAYIVVPGAARCALFDAIRIMEAPSFK